MLDTKILVIDDDTNITDFLKLQFESEGYKVKTAPNGVEGINYFKIYEPDIVILDLVMPKLDGLELSFRGSRNQRILDVPASLKAGAPVEITAGRWAGEF